MPRFSHRSKPAASRIFSDAWLQQKFADSFRWCMCDDGISSEVLWACPTWNPTSADLWRQSLPDQVMDSFVWYRMVDESMGQDVLRGLRRSRWPSSDPRWAGLKPGRVTQLFQSDSASLESRKFHP